MYFDFRELFFSVCLGLLLLAPSLTQFILMSVEYVEYLMDFPFSRALKILRSMTNFEVILKIAVKSSRRSENKITLFYALGTLLKRAL